MWKRYEIQISIPINKLLLEHSLAHLSMVAWFFTLKAELSSFQRDYMIKNIYYLVLYRKNFLGLCLPTLDRCLEKTSWLSFIILKKIH